MTLAELQQAFRLADTEWTAIKHDYSVQMAEPNSKRRALARQIIEEGTLLRSHKWIVWSGFRGQCVLVATNPVFNSPLWPYLQVLHNTYILDRCAIEYTDRKEIHLTGHVLDISVFIKKYDLDVDFNGLLGIIQEHQRYAQEYQKVYDRLLGEGNVP